MNKKNGIILGACAVVLAILVVLLLPRGKEPVEIAEVRQTDAHEPMQATPVEPEEEPVDDRADDGSLWEDDMEPEPIHYTPEGFDPHDQPITHWVRHYRPGELDEGYTLNNVELADCGFVLANAPPGHEGPRVGFVESPPIESDFPFNGIAPQWIHDLPEGTSMLVELQFSPDGENWTGWYPTEVDHTFIDAVPEFLEDGSPNPAYGYAIGGLVSWGDGLWTHVRYSIALYSETDDTPCLSTQRFFVNDSTHQQGRMMQLTEVDDLDE